MKSIVIFGRQFHQGKKLPVLPSPSVCSILYPSVQCIANRMSTTSATYFKTCLFFLMFAALVLSSMARVAAWACQWTAEYPCPLYCSLVGGFNGCLPMISG